MTMEKVFRDNPKHLVLALLLFIPESTHTTLRSCLTSIIPNIDKYSENNSEHYFKMVCGIIEANIRTPYKDWEYSVLTLCSGYSYEEVKKTYT